MFYKRPLLAWFTIHAGLGLLFLALPHYRLLVQEVLPAYSGCLLHDFLFLYCPLCGGTRAIEAILRLDFALAFSCNPLVVMGGILLLILDPLLLIAILRKKKIGNVFPDWTWIAVASVLVLYGILRNYLMIRFGYDPLGDLGPIWEILTS